MGKVAGANRDFSQNIRLSNDSYRHQRNLHVVVIGGSGSGKTRFYVKPNALQCSGSYFFLDPKGELTYSLGGAMERKGVTVTVIDFVHFRGHYNPVAYLKTDAVPDVVNLLIHFLNPATIGLRFHCKIHRFINSFRQSVADNCRNCGMLFLDINSPDVIQ